MTGTALAACIKMALELGHRGPELAQCILKMLGQ